MTDTPVNYTDDLVAQVVARYNELRSEGNSLALRTIADEVGKTVPSLRSKLVAEGAYVKEEEPAKAPKREGPTKGQMLASLDEVLVGTGLEFNTEGLKGATKDAIAGITEVARGLAQVEVAVEDEAVAM